MSQIVIQNPFRTDSAPSDVRNDGALYNATTGLGVAGRDVNADYRPNLYNRRFNIKIELERMLSESWVLQKACSAYHKAGLRRWITVNIEYEDEDFEDELEGVDDASKTKKIEQLKSKRRRAEAKALEEYVKRVKLKEILGKGEWFAEIFGGSAAIVIAEDGRPYQEEIDIDNIRTIRSLRCVDGFSLHPYLDNTHRDPTEVEHYQFVVSADMEEKLKRTSDTIGLNERLIHRSRVITFQGVEIPPDEMRRNYPSGWGKSLISVLFEVLGRYEGALSGVTNMIKFWDLFIYKMNNYASLAAEGEYDQLVERFAMIQRLMSFTNGIIMDKDEDASIQSRNYSGLADIVKTIREELIAATGIPHTILFGESPSGLGATGESESNTWAMAVSEYQETELRPKIQRALELIFKAKDGPTKGIEPESWSFSFNPVYPETQKQKLEAQSLQANNDAIYEQIGAITKEEIRTSRFSQSEFMFNMILDDETWQKLQEQEAQEGAVDPYQSLFGEPDPFFGQDQQGAGPNQGPPGQGPPGQQPPGSPPPQNGQKPALQPGQQPQVAQQQGANAPQDPLKRLFERSDSQSLNDPSIFSKTNYAKVARLHNVA